jgi:hypothetical protein
VNMLQHDVVVESTSKNVALSERLLSCEVK